MNPKLEQWWDASVGKTRFRDVCRRCGHKFHVCDNPLSAHTAAEKKGYNLETGLCRVCNVMDRMEVLVNNRGAKG